MRFGSSGREETRLEEHRSSALGPYVGLCPSAVQLKRAANKGPQPQFQLQVSPGQASGGSSSSSSNDKSRLPFVS